MEIGSNTLGPARARNGGKRGNAGVSRETFAPPARAEVNFIPSAESLATLIHSAIAALRAGVFWDRGTILNVLA